MAYVKARYPPNCETSPSPSSAAKERPDGMPNGTRIARFKSSKNAALDTIANRRNTSVPVCPRTCSVAIKYTAKQAEAASAIASPHPKCACRAKSSQTITNEPEAAKANPSQNEPLGRLRKISHAIRPTKIGVLFPSRVAFAAEVFRIDVL